MIQNRQVRVFAMGARFGRYSLAEPCEVFDFPSPERGAKKRRGKIRPAASQRCGGLVFRGCDETWDNVEASMFLLV